MASEMRTALTVRLAELTDEGAAVLLEAVPGEVPELEAAGAVETGATESRELIAAWVIGTCTSFIFPAGRVVIEPHDESIPLLKQKRPL
jgi:hypothetical protein